MTASHRTTIAPRPTWSTSPSSATDRSAPHWRSCSPSAGGGSSCSSGGPSRTRFRAPCTSTTRPAASSSRAASATSSRKISEPADDLRVANAARHDAAAVRPRGDGRRAGRSRRCSTSPTLEALLSDASTSCPGSTCAAASRSRSTTTRDVGDGRRRAGRHGGSGAADGEATAVRARYVVGCDGANSTVRDAARRCRCTDLGFFYDWLIVDVDPRRAPRVRPDQRADLRPGPARRPACRAARAGAAGSSCALPARVARRAQRRGHRVASCSSRGTSTPATPASNVTPSTRFQARWVEQWRRGRVLLAGDAAHQTPPFAGQGLCSGLRDAANLAWKLDLVLAGTSPDALLDTYGTERGTEHGGRHRPRHRDGQDDLRLRPRRGPRPTTRCSSPATTAASPPSRRSPAISDGIVLHGSPKAGELFVQGDVERDGLRMRFDDAVGAGWRLVTHGHGRRRRRPRRLVREHRRCGRRRRRRAGPARRRRHLRQMVRRQRRHRRAATSRLRPVRHGAAAIGRRRTPALPPGTAHRARTDDRRR